MPKEKTSSSIYIYIQNTLYVLRSFLRSMLPTRHYTKDLGFALGSLLEEQQHHPPLDLRNKRHVAPAMTDREIFDSMSLGDCWWDAELPQLYWYLKKKLPNLSIPESWEETMETFERSCSKYLVWISHVHGDYKVFTMMCTKFMYMDCAQKPYSKNIDKRKLLRLEMCF